MGGHSLGGSITTAYATWDFSGRPGARDLAGLVYIDGGSGTPPITPEEANQSLEELAGVLALAGLRRDPRAVRRALQLERGARRPDSSPTARPAARPSRCCRRT